MQVPSHDGEQGEAANPLPEHDETDESVKLSPSTAQLANDAPTAHEPEQAARPAVSTVPAVATPVAGEERYDYERTTIVFVAQLRPVTEAGHPREVVLSVNNGVANVNDFPLMRILTENDDLVAAARAMLEELQQDLPGRKARFLSKRTYRPAPSASTSVSSRPTTRPGASSTVAKGSAGASQAAKNAQQVAPPVPTTSNPIPKQDLTMSGLFDGLQP